MLDTHGVATHNFIATELILASINSSILSGNILYNSMNTVGIFQCIHPWSYILGYIVHRLVIIIMMMMMMIL